MDIVIKDFFASYIEKRNKIRKIEELFRKINWHWDVSWVLDQGCIKNPESLKLFSVAVGAGYYDLLFNFFIEFILHYDLVVNEDAARLFQIDFLGWNADEVTV